MFHVYLKPPQSVLGSQQDLLIGQLASWTPLSEIVQASALSFETSSRLNSNQGVCISVQVGLVYIHLYNPNSFNSRGSSTTGVGMACQR